LGLVAGAGTLLTSLYLVPELSGAVGGLAATAVFLARRRNRLAGVPLRALLPCAFLLLLLAAANGIGALRSLFEKLGPVFDGPGLPLLVSGAFAALLLTAAVQNVAESHASMLAPQRMVLAATATGLLGREGEILLTSAAPVAVSIGMLAILGMLLT
jgi:lactate permease